MILWKFPRSRPGEFVGSIAFSPGCSGGIIAGDFNPISPEDDGLVNKNELVDAWVALRRRADPDGATWGVSVERRDGLGPGRLDEVAMMGLKVEEMEVLRPGSLEVPRPGEKSVGIPWSDHCGLRCTSAVELAPSTRSNHLVCHRPRVTTVFFFSNVIECYTSHSWSFTS